MKFLMEGNISYSTFTFNLKIARFDIDSKTKYPVFFAGVLVYMFSVLCNVTILGLIVTQRNLHRPMFFILFSLPLIDLIGISAGLPRVLIDIITETNDVFYPTCVLQAFLLHLYGGAILLLLAAMSIDRYIAICNPLRYNSIMTTGKIFGLIAWAWGTDFALIIVLFSLQSRTEKCKSFITNVYCDNPSLLLLSCPGDFTVNNIYGLFITAFLQITSVSVQLFSYVHILITCVKQSHADSRVKAVNTCVAQIVTFLLFEIVSTTAILSYRFPTVSATVQKTFGLMIYVILPVINPIIYGLKTKDIRIALLVVLRKHKIDPGGKGLFEYLKKTHASGQTQFGSTTEKARYLEGWDFCLDRTLVARVLMAGNLSFSTFTFNLKAARFDIDSNTKYPVFFVGVLVYMFSVLCNVTILGLIITQRNLHRPMFFILFSLPLNDLIIINTGLPKVLFDIITETNDVYYPTCVLQAFLVHMYVGAIFLLMAVMSIDRYIAICNPLRYNSIMTPGRMYGLIAWAWGTDFALILVLFSLQARTEKCKSFITNVYCDNPSLLLLSCPGDFTVNNIYGLFITAFMQITSVSIQLFSYTYILITCVKQTHSDSRVKAVNTCVAQILAFILFEIVSSVTVLSYRVPNISANAQRTCSLLIYVILPVVNPILYGMKTKDIRIALLVVLRKYNLGPRSKVSVVKNQSGQNLSSDLSLETFDLTREKAIVAFVFAAVNYMIILFCNALLLFTIITNKALHEPMNILLFNLPINDIIGSTCLFPHIMRELLFDTRTIPISVCITQAFFTHIYAVSAVFILTAMAYDRYVAICHPMRYTTIMSKAHLTRIISLVWCSNVILISVLFILLLRLPRCRSYIAHPYCDNPTLLQLVCADTTINNIYGLLITAACQIVTVGFIFYSYLRILIACFHNKSAEVRSKALQTCGTHLIVFLLFECLGLFTIISYRIKDISIHLRKFIAVAAMILPPTLNPIIYGLRTKEIRVKGLRIFQQKVFAS
ncbi:hypothetical protein DNTS_031171 [Danionella cerebrum]|uniref:G-protein coupled receptors family 1 profile domain-containing protein n=1 Tax=Danionella cerebrum TaxID=2873325 RepID=A0A553MLU2_9TELE|nr:hypothetical protein DNTS_031171 [Danionella translucida]